MAAEDERQQFPDNAVIALGDFNETPNPDAESFSSLPSGLPEFYVLGDDIELPLYYDPAQPLLDAGLSRVEARWEDSTEDDTFIPFPRRLDYVWTSDEEIIAAEGLRGLSRRRHRRRTARRRARQVGRSAVVRNERSRVRPSSRGRRAASCAELESARTCACRSSLDLR